MKEEGRSEGALEWENIEIFAGEVERQNSFLSSWLCDPASGYFGSVGVISLRCDISNKNYILFVTKHLAPLS